MLTSHDNPKVSYFIKLLSKKKRSETGKFMIEGIHLVSEALTSGCLEKVLYSGSLLAAQEGKELHKRIVNLGIPAELVSDNIIKQVSQVETPQGIIASAFPKISDLGDMFNDGTPMIVIACGIQDPGNLGTMLRTADATGCSGFISTKGTVDAYNDKAIRASAGSIFHLNMLKVDDIIDMINSLKRRGVKVIATDAGIEKMHYNADYTGPTAVIIGSEGQGLPEDVIRASDEVVSIPMIGQAESLNAAVACSVILYEGLRQRRSDAGKTDQD